MKDKLIHTIRIRTDGRHERINALLCPATGDVIIKFGKSYTLRMPPAEAAALFKGMAKVANDVAGPELEME